MRSWSEQWLCGSHDQCGAPRRLADKLRTRVPEERLCSHHEHHTWSRGKRLVHANHNALKRIASAVEHALHGIAQHLYMRASKGICRCVWLRSML